MKSLLTLATMLLLSCTTHTGDQKYSKTVNAFYTPENTERQKGDLYIPEGAGPFPGVVLVHGGGWDSRSLDDMNSIAKSLASHGFVVYNINYRLSPEFHHPAPIDDLGVALKFFRDNSTKYKLDPKRIALWGYSCGSHISAFYALTHAKDPELKVQAVVAGGSPMDFTWYPHSPIISKYMGKQRDEMLEQYFAVSPMYMVTKEAPPFFLYHAEDDKLVEFAQSAAFEAQLKKHNVPVELHKIGWWGHATAFIFSEQSVIKGIDFLKKRL